MRALRRNVLRELRQEIEWRENLEIPIRARFEVVGIRVGKGLTSLLLGFVDNLSSIGNLNQPRDRLKGQRTMYCTSRWIPSWSSADKSTDWSTLKPLCSQERIFSTTSGSILPSLRYRENTVSCHAASRLSISNSGNSRNSPSGVKAPHVNHLLDSESLQLCYVRITEPRECARAKNHPRLDLSSVSRFIATKITKVGLAVEPQALRVFR